MAAIRGDRHERETVPTVDVHAHVVIPSAEALLQDHPGLQDEQRASATALGRDSAAVNRDMVAEVMPALTDPQERLRRMDASGVDIQVVSPIPTHHYWAPADLARDFSATLNSGIAAHCATANDRLIGLGTVPLQHADLAIEVLDGLMELGLRGIEVSTHVEGEDLTVPRLEPFWARVEDLGAIVFIHPWGCTLGERLSYANLANIVGQPVETSVAIAHLIFSGLLDRHPDLKIVTAHGGGYLPHYVGRMDHSWAARADSRTCKDRPSSYLSKLWYDNLVYTPETLRSLVQAVGWDRVVVGTDYPFDMGIEDPLARLESAQLTSEATVAIRGGNAARLLGLSMPECRE